MAVQTKTKLEDEQGGAEAEATDELVAAILKATASSMTDLTQIQRRAAVLMAKTLDPEAVDKVYGLSHGQVRTWVRTDERFAAAVVTERVRFESYHDPVEDLAAALTERQVQAAEMLAAGRKTVQVARDLDITDRTIRGWKKDPVFSLYLEELQRGERARKKQVKEEGEQLLHERLRTVAISAVNAAEGEIKRGNGRVAAELLKVAMSVTR